MKRRRRKRDARSHELRPGFRTLLSLVIFVPLLMAREPIVQHPAGVLQETLGAAMAATSRGQVRHVGDVAVYENCRGTCSVLALIEPNAMALGHKVFAEGTLDMPHLQHELTHVRQAERLGLLWLPAYIREGTRHAFQCGLDFNCYHERNRFEIEALNAERDAFIAIFRPLARPYSPYDSPLLAAFSGY